MGLYTKRQVFMKTVNYSSARYGQDNMNEHDMYTKAGGFRLTDNGGRRRGERRQFSYSSHVPERRTGPDRREFEDRRRSFRAK